MKFFIGSHSTIIINPRYIVFAKGGNYDASPIEIVLRDGRRIDLEGQDASMFRTFILNLNKDKNDE